MQWRVKGADRATGVDKVLLIEAEDEAQAARRATRAGLFVESARPNVAPLPPVKSNNALWLTLLIVGPVLAIAVGVYFVQPSKPVPTPTTPAIVAATSLAASTTTPQAASEQSSVAAQQLAELQAENARLKAAALTPPVVVASPQPGSITGAAWLQKNGGDTALMRGLHVYLARPVFSDSGPVCDQLQTTIPDWEKLIADYRKMIAGVHDSIAQYGDANGQFKESLDSETKDLADYEGRVALFRRVIQQRPTNMTTSEAYRILLRSAVRDRVTYPISSISVMDTHANVDGKYSLTNVPPGDYVIFANFDSLTTAVDWLVPVHVNSGELKSVDLLNENSVHIHNDSN